MAEKKKFDLNQRIQEIGVTKLLLMAGCGIVLIMLPEGTKIKPSKDVNKAKHPIYENRQESSRTGKAYTRELEERLEQILENTKGVGEAQVMITLKNSYEKVVLMEERESEETSQEGDKKLQTKSYENQAVLENDSPFVINEKEPEIMGVYVVAKGGNNSEVALRITNIIQSLFDVEPHKIFVAGME